MHIEDFFNTLNIQLLLIENASEISDYAKVDLSESTLKTKNIEASNPQELQVYLDGVQQNAKAKVLYGGYLEKRNLYAKSAMFTSKEVRNIHLGLDFWAPAYTGVIAPIDGKVHSAHYNEGEGNYGGTIILKHSVDEFSFFSLYGHLSKSSLKLKKGAAIRKGEIFCFLGKMNENGNYLPHLHFQWIVELPSDATDYPGVCSEHQIEYFAKNSPEPRMQM